jgi:hypothetical protein
MNSFITYIPSPLFNHTHKETNFQDKVGRNPVHNTHEVPESGQWFSSVFDAM